jgi:hypothetical protein
MDHHKTTVIFRKFKKDGEVIAFFPNEPEWRGCIGSYMHIGQHGIATYPNDLTVPATPEEYSPLLQELGSLGYNVKIAKRRVYRPAPPTWEAA